MANLNEQIEQVQIIFNDIEGALKDQGVDTNGMKPSEYAKAVRGIVNSVSVENVSFLPVIVFCYSSTIPKKPEGGQWIINDYTNQVVAPTGWYLDLDEVEDASVETDGIYMSTCIFKQDGTKFMNWITPIRISGKDGKDGERGNPGPPGNIAGVVVEYNTPIYTITSSQGLPSTPDCSYDIQNKNLLIYSEGWSLDTPDQQTLGANILWQSIARYNSNDTIVICSNPVRISAGNPDVILSDGFWTEYYITTSINEEKKETGWFTPQSADPPVPTIINKFLWARDVMKTSVSGKHVGPAYLFATYDAGLIGIDVDYTCALDARAQLEDLWFDDTISALTPDVTKNYSGLTEDTKYLWAREQFLYSNKEPDVSYRIISTFTAAEKAAIIYSAGIFNEKVNYTRTSEQRPYIYYPEGLKLDNEGKIDENGKEYYYFVLKYSYDDPLYKIDINSNSYSFDFAYENKNWEKMESFEAIYSDIGVFKAANVGKFVFDDRWIFSQKGINEVGESVDYTQFTDYSVDNLELTQTKRVGVALAIEMNAFIPNVLIDGITGEAWFGHKSVYFESAGKGWLAGGNIVWDENGNILIGKDSAENNGEDAFVSFKGGNLNISGNITLGANSSGLANLSEWASANMRIQTAQTTADTANVGVEGANARIDTLTRQVDNVTVDLRQDLQTAKDDITKSYTASVEALELEILDLDTRTTTTVEDLNRRLDGVVVNHFKKGNPPTNIDALYVLFEITDSSSNSFKNHIGDTYTNIDNYVDDTQTPNAGRSWRWCQWDGETEITDEMIEDPSNEGSYYYWHIITDTDALRALQEARTAQTTADGKSKTFLIKPTGYKFGDFWVLEKDYSELPGKQGDLFVANFNYVDKFKFTDWGKITNSSIGELSEEITGKFGEFEQQLDLKIETYYQDADPSTAWTSVELMEYHNGDIWYAEGSVAKRYSYDPESGSGKWISMSDSEAIIAAKEAQAAADGKVVTFLNMPDSEYKEGDLWIISESDSKHKDYALKEGDLYYAVNDMGDVFNINDWSKVKNSEISDFIENTYSTDIAELQNTLDGKIETWFQNEDPSEADGWINENHVGDLWYDTDATPNKSYIFVKNGNSYEWQSADSSAQAALTAAKNAQDTADGKRTTFTKTPTIPYYEGDLWVGEGADGDILKCKNTKTSGAFSKDDWEKAAKYTDDTYAITEISGINTTISDINSNITGIQEDVTEAQERASTALAKAETATGLLDDWASDNKLSPGEQRSLKDEWDSECINYTTLISTISSYDTKYAGKEHYNGLANQPEYSALTKAKESADKAIVYHTTGLDTNTSVEIISDTENESSYDKIQHYYECKQAMLNKITELLDAFADAKINDAAVSISTFETTMSTLESDLLTLNSRLDGVVVNHFKTGNPTEWMTDETKDEDLLFKKTYSSYEEHLGDTYTDIAINEEESPTYGKSWRWCKVINGYTSDDSVEATIYEVYDEENNIQQYHWHIIADSDAVKALLEASKAKTAADGKARNFITQPEPPYSVGDTWMQGSSGDIMRCKVARESGSFNASDWEIAAKYTDDTAANEAKTAAETAQEKADDAYTLANTTITKIKDWASDNKISPTEILGIEQELTFIIQDFGEIQESANLYDVDTSVFGSYYSDYQIALNKILTTYNSYGDKTASVDIPSNFSTRASNYYTVRATVLKNIASATKSLINTKASPSDFEYLKNAFGDAKSMSVEGVVMSQMIAVADVSDAGSVTEGDVEAFLNGSDEFSDDEHGKLILAGGIPETTVAGSTDLKERAKEATTRIYEDGSINAKSGFFEGIKTNSLRRTVAMIDPYVHFDTPWYIDEFKKTNGQPNSPDDIILAYDGTKPTKENLAYYNGGMSLSWQTEPDLSWDISQIGRTRTFISHRHIGGFCNTYATLTTPDNPNGDWIEGDGTNPPYFYYDGMATKSLRICPNDCYNLYGYGYYTNKEKTEGVFMGWVVTSRMSLYGKYSNIVEYGMFAGLRPNIKHITTSATLSSPHVITEFDYTILVEINTTETAVYLKLPTTPQEGQRYEIITTDQDIDLSINTSGYDFYDIVTASANTTGTVNFTAQHRRCITLMFVNNRWYAYYWNIN